jgi:hypothetical protein
MELHVERLVTDRLIQYADQRLGTAMRLNLDNDYSQQKLLTTNEILFNE